MANEINLMKLCHMMCHTVGIIIYNICGHLPLKNWEKTSKIRRDLGQLSTSTANISGTD